MATPASLAFFDRGPTKAKICGLTRADEATQVVERGADALGLNFWPRSKRYLPLEDGLPWLRELAGEVTRIGVFVNATEDEIIRTLESGAIDVAQLHGDESISQVASLLDRGYHVFKALGVKDRAALEAAALYPGDTLLLDAWAPVEYGGTGETMDWALGHEAVVAWPDRRIVLAGGLTPDTVAEAIRQVRPFAVDVASGVEAGTPGRKDLDRVAAFLEAVREIG